MLKEGISASINFHQFHEFQSVSRKKFFFEENHNFFVLGIPFEN